MKSQIPVTAALWAAVVLLSSRSARWIPPKNACVLVLFCAGLPSEFPTSTRAKPLPCASVSLLGGLRWRCVISDPRHGCILGHGCIAFVEIYSLEPTGKCVGPVSGRYLPPEVALILCRAGLSSEPPKSTHAKFPPCASVI